MSLFGKNRDINFLKSINKELLHDIIEQQIGYYKPKLDQIETNIYGETPNKFWIGPVLIKCLIDRGAQDWKVDEVPDVNRSFKFRFLKDDLTCADILTEVGDVIVWEDDYYEIDAVVQNQLIVGKSNEYNYSDSVVNFGSSLSIIVSAHYSRPEKLGITRDRL